MTDDELEAVVRERLPGLKRGDRKALAHELGISDDQLYRIIDRIRKTPPPLPAVKRLRPLSIFTAAGVPSEGIKKRGAGYLIERLLPHEEWLVENPDDDDFRVEARWMRQEIARKTRDTGWLTISYERMRQLYDLKKSR